MALRREGLPLPPSVRGDLIQPMVKGQQASLLPRNRCPAVVTIPLNRLWLSIMMVEKRMEMVMLSPEHAV